jgi:hypothetical protein
MYVDRWISHVGSGKVTIARSCGLDVPGGAASVLGGSPRCDLSAQLASTHRRWTARMPPLAYEDMESQDCSYGVVLQSCTVYLSYRT